MEDAPQKTQLVANLLQNSGIPYTHLCIQTMEGVTKARGTFQRNLGLSWLRETFYPEDAPEGVVYFADDDNTYSLEIFEEVSRGDVYHVSVSSTGGGVREAALTCLILNATKCQLGPYTHHIVLPVRQLWACLAAISWQTPNFFVNHFLVSRTK